MFCRWLSTCFEWARDCRLPTEAEWEYSCRAGTESRYWSGDDESDLARVGWYDESSGNRTHRVGEKEANPWGLYDVHGNVLEWCRDWYGPYVEGEQKDPEGPAAGDSKVLRGGSFAYSPRFLRSAFRNWFVPEVRGGDFGFRCVRLSGRQR